MDTLAERLRYARELAGLSGRELDRLAGIAGNHTMTIERAQRQTGVRSSTALALSRVLGLTLEWLLDGRGIKPSARRVRAAVARARAAETKGAA